MRISTSSASMFVAAYMMSLVLAFWPALPATVPALALLMYLVLSAFRIQRMQALLGVAFLLVGVALAATAGGLDRVIVTVLNAAELTLPLLLLFGAVAWLNHAILADPAFHALSRVIGQLPARRSNSVMSLSSHFIGGTLTLAGFNLIAAIAGYQTDQLRQKRMTQAAVRGFTIAACWSPFFVGMAAALTAVSARWADVALQGVSIAMLLMGLVWLRERLRPSDRAADTTLQRDEKLDTPIRSELRWITIMLAGVMAPVLLLHEVAGFSIPTSIALACPCVAIAIIARTNLNQIPSTARTVWLHLPSLSNELFVLLAANIFALGLLTQDTLVDHLLGWLPAALSGSLLAPGALVLAGTGLAALGIHPLVVITFIAGIMPTDTPAPFAATIALALAIVWGLGTMISPISALTMIVARSSGHSPLRVSWGWNGLFTVTATILAAGALTLLLMAQTVLE